MKNKSVNMKKFIATPFLFCLSLFAFQAQAQESVEVVIRDNGTERQESIELPQSMTYPLDSTENPLFSDSVYIDRLSRIPAVMEMPYNEIVRKFIDMYTGRLRNNVSFMLSACNFYMPIFEEALDAYGLPLELRYLPIIESALNPSARSRVGASGLWQFMLATGKMYGLESNSLIDERCDPIKATWAAARYLKETRGYVPAFIAANYVMTYYCKHNICPMETNIPDATDTIQVTKNLHFEQLADICGVSMEEIKSLNPQYKKNIIPGDSKTQTLRLPMNYISTFIDSQDTIYAHRANELFKNRRTVAISEPRSTARRATTGSGNLTYHKIRNGETLGTIARRYGVTVKQLQSWNGLHNTKISAGKQLKIYK